MTPVRVGARAALLAAVTLGASLTPACGRSDRRTREHLSPDTAARPPAATPPAAESDRRAASAPVALESVGVVEGFRAPESVAYDSTDDVLYVSNIHGEATARDNNGFIARLPADRLTPVVRLVEGGRQNVTLNAPKGLAIVGDTLWVADLDALRGFHKRTGAPLATVDLAPLQASFLNDVAVGGDGALYVTDTERDRLYRIAGRTATVVLEGDVLGHPNGIAWDARHGRFLLAPSGAPAVQAWTPGEPRPTPLATGPGSYDGIAVLGDGRVLVTSWADSSVSVLAGGRLERLLGGVDAPADIGIDTRRHRLVLPRLTAGRVELYRLP